MIDSRGAQIRLKLKEDLEFYEQESEELELPSLTPVRKMRAPPEKKYKVERRTSKFDTVSCSW